MISSFFPFFTPLTLKKNEFLVKEKEIQEIITKYDGLARTTNIKVVDGTQLVERDDLSDEFKNMLSVEATNNSEKDNLFSSGIFTIIKGRYINNNDRGKILIHKELAEKNNEAFRAEAKKFLDKMYYDAVKEINYNS